MVVAISTIDFFARDTTICLGEMEKKIIWPARLDIPKLQLTLVPRILSHFGQMDHFFASSLKLFFVEFFNVKKPIISRFKGTDQFIQFKLNGGRITVLCILDQEDHQKRNDGRASVDHQLPGIAKPEDRTQNCPNDYHGDRSDKCQRLSSRG